MKKETKKWIGGFGTCAILVGIVYGIIFFTTKKEEKIIVQVEEPKISHQQEIWISALEWCESNGNVNAINPKDKDGTPSYYSFQFKPETFKYYGEMYWVIEPGLKDEEIMERIKDNQTQRTIVENMVLDKAVDFRQQFPACTKKLGLPPTK